MFNSKKASVLKKKRFHKKVIGSIIVIFLIFSTSFFVGRKDIRSSVFSFIQESSISVYNTVSTVSFAPFKWLERQINFIDDLYSVNSENEKLKKELEYLKKFHLEAQAIKNKNNLLKKQLFFSKNIKRKYITAKISTDISSSFSKSILINAGKNQNVEKFSPVLANGYLLGQIINVYKNSSRVLLITDTSIKVPVITSKTRHRFFLSGNNQSSAFLIYPEDKTDVEKGEAVITSGFGNEFPADVLIGTISETSKILKVSPFISVRDVEFVQILAIPKIAEETEKELEKPEIKKGN